LDKP